MDSEPHSVAAWLEVLEGLGHPATAADVEACVGLGFPPTRDALAGIAPLPGPEELWPVLLGALERSFRSRGLATFDDAITLLREVEGRGLPWAVVSGSPRSRLDLTLDTAGLKVGVSVAGDEVAAPKPAPDPYLAAANSVGAEASHCMVVEDTPTGVRSGKAAAMRVVGVARNPGDAPALEAAGADVVVDRLHVGVLSALPKP